MTISDTPDPVRGFAAYRQVNDVFKRPKSGSANPYRVQIPAETPTLYWSGANSLFQFASRMRPPARANASLPNNRSILPPASPAPQVAQIRLIWQ